MESLDKLIEKLVLSTAESLSSESESSTSDGERFSRTSADSEELIFTPSGIDDDGFEDFNTSVLSRKLHDQLRDQGDHYAGGENGVGAQARRCGGVFEGVLWE
jgi:hypothetical protein